MDRILIILKKENGPRASSAPALGLNTIIFKHVYWYMQQTQVSVYRTIGPLVFKLFWICMESSVFRVTMGPYGISNNERNVHTIDGHTKCLYAAKFALEWRISDT